MNAIGESEKLKAFFRTGHKRQYQKGETILRAGDDPAGLYFIDSGLVKIFVNDKNGAEHITHFFGGGDFFPLIWLFREEFRMSTYQALEPTTIWLVSKADFMEHIMSSRDILFEMLEEMAERYIRYTGRIENLLYSDARERCAYRLLSLGNRFGRDTPEGLVILAGITQEDMARSVNMTRETLGRALSRLQSHGVIGYDDEHHIIIKDVAALVKVIGRHETEKTWPALMKYIID